MPLKGVRKKRKSAAESRRKKTSLEPEYLSSKLEEAVGRGKEPQNMGPPDTVKRGDPPREKRGVTNF